MPDFSLLAPLFEGVINTVTIDKLTTGRAKNYQFAYAYETYININTAGVYEFELASSSGSRLIINGEVVIDNDHAGPVQSLSGTKNLAAGRHLSQILYFHNITPQPGLNFEYFRQDSWFDLPPHGSIPSPIDTNGAYPVTVPPAPLDSGVLNNISLSPSDDDGRDKEFAIRFHGFIFIGIEGDYTFRLRSSEGSRFLFQSDTIFYDVDLDGVHPTTTNTRLIPNLEINYYQFELHYFKTDPPGFRRSYYTGSWNAFTSMPDIQATGSLQAEDYPNSLALNSINTRDFNRANVFDGYIDILIADAYEFRLISCEGSRLFVDGVLIVDNTNDSVILPENTVASGLTPPLTLGRHYVKIEYWYPDILPPTGAYTNGVHQRIVDVEGGGAPQAPLPGPQLGTYSDYRRHVGFLEVYPYHTFVSNRTNTNFNIDNGGMGSFTNQFWSYLLCPASGAYEFDMPVDDEARLFINGTMVARNMIDNTPVNWSTSVNLHTGFHHIYVDFRNQGGPANLSVNWTGPGIGWQSIPNGNLFLHNSSMPLAPGWNDYDPNITASYRQVGSGAWVDLPDANTYVYLSDPKNLTLEYKLENAISPADNFDFIPVPDDVIYGGGIEYPELSLIYGGPDTGGVASKNPIAALDLFTEIESFNIEQSVLDGSVIFHENVSVGSSSGSIIRDDLHLYTEENTNNLAITYMDQSVTYSDENFKKNISPLELSFEQLFNIRGISYEWEQNLLNKLSNSLNRRFGVSAQEVEKVFKELIIENKDHLTVNYDSLQAIVVKSLQGIDERIQMLESNEHFGESS